VTADPEQVVSDLLSQPKSMMVDGNKVENPDLDDAMKAADWLAREKGRTNRPGIQIFKLRPPGAP